MDNQRSNHKLWLILFTMVVAACLVVANVFFTMVTHVHIWSGENVLTSKISSSIVDTVLEARRGIIYDRSGNIIAQEVKAYTVVAYLDESVTDDAGDPDYVSNARTTAKKLKELLPDIDEEQVQSILEAAMKNGQVQTELGTGTKRLDKDTMEAIEEADIPGIGFVETTNRNYPASPYSSNLIGFAGYDEDLQSITGKMGLEQTLNDYLTGVDGRIRYQQAVDGTVLPGTTSVYEQAIAGDNVVLTLDSNLQQVVEEQMQITMESNKAVSAWCVVMEPETGKILAWASYPTFNQNDPSQIPSFIDNVSEKNVEVGSVMKPITYAVAIDTGVYEGDTTYRAGTFNYTLSSSGKIVRVDNSVLTEFQPINEALGEDFGTITFDQGLWFSSNVGICELLANYINFNDYESYLKAFGLFDATNIEYVNEVTGMKNLATATDYLSTGFGQGTSVSVLQLCQAYTAIFNDGKMMKPYVVESILSPDGQSVLEEFEPEVVGQPISSETANRVTQLMKGVLNEDASGARFAIEGLDMAAKTGTGQLYNEETGFYDSYTYTSSIMAAAPADDPKIMVYWGMQSANYINYSSAPFQEIMMAALLANGVSGAEEITEEEESQWDSYSMPSLVNHSRSYADGQLAGKNLNVVTIGDGSTVINQYPSADTTVTSYTTVILLTDGASITMPDMTGWTRKDVTAFWQLTGIGIQTSGYGVVTGQNIDPGTPIDSSSDIQVVLQQIMGG